MLGLHSRFITPPNQISVSLYSRKPSRSFPDLTFLCKAFSVCKKKMGRGVSSGGGQSSLGYLFGTDEPAAKPAPRAAPPAVAEPVKNTMNPIEPAPKAHALKENSPDVPAGVLGSNANNYFRAEGQNCGNFLTDRPSTKVHSAPGGGSSLGYLFGGPPSGN